MLSIQPLKSAQSASDYYASAFQYYAGDATAMLWMGQACKHLNLHDQIEKEVLLSLLEGTLPNGQQLQNRQGDHRPGFDMTFSAPKSVSLLVGLGVAPELTRYHDEAVEKAIAQIETEFAEARVSRDGVIHYEKTGNLLVAAFRQPSSRANDPALHTHCVTMNLTFHDGKARSLSSDSTRTHGVIEQIQNNAHYCGLLYRQHLANRLKESGFHLRPTGDGLFEIDGIPEEVLSEFSKRREAIASLMETQGWTGAKSASTATLLTRAGKEDHDFESLQADWKERAQILGFDAKAFMQTKGEISKSRPGFISLLKDKWQTIWLSTSAPASLCVKTAIETLSQRTSVFSERDLKKESMKHALLCDEVITYQNLETAIQREKTTEALYCATCPQTKETLLTTPWLLTLEAETIARVERNKGIVQPIATQGEVQAFLKERREHLSHPMTHSQKNALISLFRQQDRITAIQGYAGTAKTTMLSEAKILMDRQGYQLQGITVASSASFELETKAGIPSQVFPLAYYYQVGDILRFNQDCQKGIKQGLYYSVGKISKKHRQDNVLPLINESGKTIHFSLSKLPAYKTHTAAFERPIEVYQPQTLPLQAGDKVMWTKNLKSENIRNGETLTLQKMQDDSLIFTTHTGQSLTFDKNHPALKHLNYSYVLTNYKVQGKDADYAIGLMESYHRFGATLENFYVQISRALHEMILVTDNREMLSKAIQHHRDEKAASLDILSSQKLAQHEERFKSQSHLSIQPVIEKKLKFELER